ncbi:MAG: MFS transporter, partial [Prevotella bivia]|nr:MFS transporter [Prevotella bivia]
MDTQNTPIHIRLWNRHFWRLALANLFLVMSVYMLIPTLPLHLYTHGYTNSQLGWVMLCFSLGMFIFGGFSGYLVQRFRRNVVCILSILCMT